MHRSLAPSRPSVARWPCQFWADCTINIYECEFPTGTPVGAAGFEPLALRTEFAKALSAGLEKSNMRISSKAVVSPLCQRKSQAMTNTIGSDSEMQRFE